MALTERDQLMRYKYCHGPVQALKESSSGARAIGRSLTAHGRIAASKPVYRY